MRDIGDQGKGKWVFLLNNLILSNNFECVLISPKLDIPSVMLCWFFPSDLTLKLITTIQLVLNWRLNAKV